jgi:hypothetical protein
MRRWAFALLLVVFASASVYGQQQKKVAVIDASISENIDESAVVPVTYRIMEELVTSDRFIVLERSNVEKILNELNFQFSGVVSDEEIKEIGVALGAEIIVLSEISKVGSTYSLTARMVNVESLKVEKAVSESKSGEIDELLEMSQLVGRKLAYDGDLDVEEDYAAATSVESNNTNGTKLGFTLNEGYRRPALPVGITLVTIGIAGITVGIIDAAALIFDDPAPAIALAIGGGVSLIGGGFLLTIQSPKKDLAVNYGINSLTLTVSY